MLTKKCLSKQNIVIYMEAHKIMWDSTSTLQKDHVHLYASQSYSVSSI